MNFYQLWHIIEQRKLLEEGIQSFMKANPKKSDDPQSDFFVIYGPETFTIKDSLKNLRFRYFAGKWSMSRSAISQWSDEQRAAFQQLSGVDVIQTLDSPAVGRSDENQPSAQPTQILSAMKAEIDGVKGKSGEKASQILDIVKREIEKLASMTDEAAKSEFIQNFWQFAAKFHQYSFHNQMLIFLQNNQATYVNSEARWGTMGRVIDEGKRKEGLTILAPRFYKKKDPNPDTDQDKNQEKATYFVAVKVWDIASTIVIPGQEDQAHVFQPQDWKLDTNETREEITLLIDAGIAFAKDKNIKIDYQELGTTGGFSTGKGITINSTYDGVNKFSTLVHEITHELFHHKLDRELRMDKETLEHDAEATAFVVLSYFGLETKDSPRYLALWKADSRKIKNRGSEISKAAKEIIQGIMKNVEKMDVEPSD